MLKVEFYLDCLPGSSTLWNIWFGPDSVRAKALLLAWIEFSRAMPDAVLSRSFFIGANGIAALTKRLAEASLSPLVDIV
jgi:hypothetical protein